MTFLAVCSCLDADRRPDVLKEEYYLKTSNRMEAVEKLNRQLPPGWSAEEVGNGLEVSIVNGSIELVYLLLGED